MTSKEYDMSQASTLTANSGGSQRSGLPPKHIDYRRLLTRFLEKNDPTMIPNVDKMLSRHKGKEAKLFLVLAKKYDSSNALNRVFVSKVTDEHFDDNLQLVTLYLSIFYPQDVDQADKLLLRHKDNIEELFKKLSSNFMAINPMKMDRESKSKTLESINHKSTDYQEVLTAFYEEHDPEKVDEVNDVIAKCKGKESILFAVLASKYNAPNALNAVFEDRLKEIKCSDHLTLLKLYLSVFHPSKIGNSKTMLIANKGHENDLFSKLATQFRAINPLTVVEIEQNSLETIDEALNATTKPAVIENGYTSPARGSQRKSIPRSPAVTP